MKDYVEDSTKGRSRVNPREYKRDILMQVWLQSRHLATLLKWLEGEGMFVRFRSEIVQITLEQVVEHLVSAGVVEMVEYAEDAQRLLERFEVKSNIDGRGRGGKNAFHNLTLDDRRKSRQVGGYNPESRFSYKPVEDVQPKDDEQPSFNNKTEFNMDEAVRIYNEKEDEDIKKAAEGEKEKVLANADIDENGVITPRGEPRGPVYQEDMDAYNKREEGRKRIEEIEKRNKVIEKREEKLNEELCSIKEKEYEDELVRGREGNSDGLKEERSDVSEDSL